MFPFDDVTMLLSLHYILGLTYIHIRIVVDILYLICATEDVKSVVICVDKII